MFSRVTPYCNELIDMESIFQLIVWVSSQIALDYDFQARYLFLIVSKWLLVKSYLIIKSLPHVVPIDNLWKNEMA